MVLRLIGHLARPYVMLRWNSNMLLYGLIGLGSASKIAYSISAIATVGTGTTGLLASKYSRDKYITRMHREIEDARMLKDQHEIAAITCETAIYEYKRELFARGRSVGGPDFKLSGSSDPDT